MIHWKKITCLGHALPCINAIHQYWTGWGVNLRRRLRKFIGSRMSDFDDRVELVPAGVIVFD